jgi:hypothetical protein
MGQVLQRWLQPRLRSLQPQGLARLHDLPFARATATRLVTQATQRVDLVLHRHSESALLQPDCEQLRLASEELRALAISLDRVRFEIHISFQEPTAVEANFGVWTDLVRRHPIEV